MSGRGDDSDFGFSCVNHPAVKRLMDKTVRPVGLSVIDQPTDDTDTTIRITLSEEERIGRKIAVQLDFTRVRGMPLPLPELFKTLLKHPIADTLGILHYLVVVLLTHDLHGC